MTSIFPSRSPARARRTRSQKLSEDQKEVNRALSQIRIFVENAIGGMKRYNILVERFRNHKPGFDDDAIAICAGLWNFSQQTSY